MRRYSLQQFIENANKIHHNKYDYSKFIYKNSRTNGLIICKKHNISFIQNPQRHLRGCGCRKCGREETTKKQLLPKELFIKKSNIIHNNIYDYKLVVYKNNKTKVKIICKKHGIFEQSPNSHRRSGCPTCCLSKGEIKVKKFLDINNIKYISQKKFNDCIGKKRELPFDFYLTDYNICIEYDGIQHFKGWVRYKEQKKRNLIMLNVVRNNDKIKTNYCKNNNIKLIRIKYSEFENIDTILKKEILKINN